MKIDMMMTSDHPGVAESGRPLPVGTTVEYMAHLGWGAVRVRMSDGTIEVVSPRCFAQLR